MATEKYLAFEGSLDLCHLQEDDFFQFDTSLFGKYELIDNMLRYLPMTLGAHDVAVHIAMDVFHNTKRQHLRQAKIEHTTTPFSHLLALPNKIVSINGSSHLRPDLAVGTPTVGDTQPSFPRHRPPPHLVLEVASNNKQRDYDKIQKYVEARIQTYVIVDRDVKRIGKPNHHPAVHVGTLADGRYNFLEFSQGEQIQLLYIGHIRTGILRNSPSPLPDNIMNSVDRELEEINEWQRKVNEARQEAGSALEREAHTKNKKNKHKNKSRERKILLRDNGFDVSSSSSSSSSNRSGRDGDRSRPG